MTRYLFFALTVASLSLFGVPTSAQPKRIREGFWKATVRIESGGGVGSGFLVGRPIIRDGKTNNIMYLVLCKHQIGDWNVVDGEMPKYYDTLRIYFYSTNMQPTEVRIKDEEGLLNPLISLHPSPRVDVAIIAIMNEVCPSSVLGLHTSYLTRFNSERVGICDQVFAFGYPAGVTSLGNYYPLPKAGYVSSLPREEFRLQMILANRSNVPTLIELKAKIYLVDGLIVGGNSGGPVMLPDDFSMWSEGNEVKWIGGQRDQVIGIVSMGIPGNLTVVYSSDYILELIEEFEKHVVSVTSNTLEIK